MALIFEKMSTTALHSFEIDLVRCFVKPVLYCEAFIQSKLHLCFTQPAADKIAALVLIQGTE